MKIARLILSTVLLLVGMTAAAQVSMRTNPNARNNGGNYQNYNEDQGRIDAGSNHMSWGRDTTKAGSTKEVPIGVFQWVLDERLGTVIPAENNDTVHHRFQNWHLTDGMNGEYNILGNAGSPRLSRIYMHRNADRQFIFLNPYSYFLGGLQDFRFSNTLSPITNLAYHKVGNRVNGQERVRAYFASNISKVAGIGFKLDYLYGRGYYNQQANSQFGGTVFGYYRGDRYEMHAWVNANHSKMGENGGIENDEYILNPMSFPQKYGSRDIPTNLTDTWNRNDNQVYYLTHRFNMGFERDIEVPDSLKPKMPSERELLAQLKDSIRQVLQTDSVQRLIVLDSLRNKWQASLITPQEFVPVSSIIHTFQVKNLQHTFYTKSNPGNYFANNFYGSPSSVRDISKALSVRNTVGLALREGFQKWAAMGLTAFATHEMRTFQLPVMLEEPRANPDSMGVKRYVENSVSVGGELARAQGDLLHYNIHGEAVVLGKTDFGQFNVDGNLDLNFGIGKKDTLSFEAHGLVERTTPGFFYRHYHSQFSWWDNNDLKKEFRTRVEGTLRNKRTKTAITVGLENVKNYTYFAMQKTLIGKDSTSIIPADFRQDVGVMQYGKNIQIFSVSLKQDIKAGPFCWDNEVTYQKSSNQTALPLPTVNVYSNMYLKFCFAKVLNVEVGGDVRYWTKYYAPDYAPAINQFVVQDANFTRIQTGNYPVVNVYANMHLKHCRIYVAMNHVNAGHGHMFWAPHYAMDPRAFHFGVSWNFFN